MGSGFHATRLSASCIGSVSTGDIFGQSTAHLCWGANDVAGPQSNLTSGGCWYDSSHVSYPTAPRLTAKQTYAYGYTPHSGPAILPTDWFFDLAELNTKVGPYVITPFPSFPAYSRTIKGWRFQNSMCVLPLVRKYSNHTPLWTDFTNVRWTDFYPPDPLQPDIGTDWMGNFFNDGESPSHYAMFSQGVTYPFKGETWYEDTTSSIDKSKSSYQIGFAPFCDHIAIYDNTGATLGYADGMAHQLFIFNGVIKDRFRPPLVPGDPGHYLATNLQYWSIELWTYLSVVGTGGHILKSPRMFTERWWYYSQQGFVTGTISPSSPYFFLTNNMQSSRSVRFNLLDNTNNPTHLANKDYDTPWSQGRLYLTA